MENSEEEGSMVSWEKRNMREAESIGMENGMGYG